MIRGPLFAEPRGRGWYIADAEMREVSCALYISKRAAVAAIRAMAAPAEVGHPLFYTVKNWMWEWLRSGCRLRNIKSKYGDDHLAVWIIPVCKHVAEACL
jgi:hypothetical protein